MGTITVQYISNSEKYHPSFVGDEVFMRLNAEMPDPIDDVIDRVDKYSFDGLESERTIFGEWIEAELVIPCITEQQFTAYMAFKDSVKDGRTFGVKTVDIHGWPDELEMFLPVPFVLKRIEFSNHYKTTIQFRQKNDQ